MIKITNFSLTIVFNSSGSTALSVDLLTEIGVFNTTQVGNFSKDQIEKLENKINKKINGKTLSSELLDDVADFLPKEADEGFYKLLEIVFVKALASLHQQPVYKYLADYLDLTNNFNLPTPIITMFNGGRFGDTNLDFEEYQLIPLAKNSLSLSERLVKSAIVYKKLGQLLMNSGYDLDLGEFGGYAPDLFSSIEAFDLMSAAISLSGYELGKDFGFGVNIGSEHLYDRVSHKYLFKLSNNYFSSLSLTQLYKDWLVKYPLFYLEDYLLLNDEQGLKEVDDLSHSVVLAMSSHQNLAVKMKGENAKILALSDFDSLKSMADFVKTMKKHQLSVVIKAEDQETGDSFIADLAVALGADFVKFGSLARAERVEKLNRLIKIEKFSNYIV